MNKAQQIMAGQVTTVELSTPITAHGESVKSLQLRRPTTAEVRKIGRLPYLLVDASGKFTPQLDVVAEYISVCAAIPPSSVDQLDLHDLNQLAWGVCGFFMSPASSASSS